MDDFILEVRVSMVVRIDPVVLKKKKKIWREVWLSLCFFSVYELLHRLMVSFQGYLILKGTVGAKQFCLIFIPE